MALQFSKTQFGVEFEESYLMVKSLRFNKENLNLEVICMIYPDKACRDAGSDCLEVKRINVSVENSSVDLFEAAYNHLKSLDEYAEAIDILDENEE